MNLIVLEDISLSRERLVPSIKREWIRQKREGDVDGTSENAGLLFSK